MPGRNPLMSCKSEGRHEPHRRMVHPSAARVRATPRLSGCARHGDGWLANVNCADANGLRIALLQTKQFTFSEDQVAPQLRRANAAQFNCKPTPATFATDPRSHTQNDAL